MRYLWRLLRAVLVMVLVLTAVPSPAAGAPLREPGPPPATPHGNSFSSPLGCATANVAVSNTTTQDFEDFETITSTVTVNSAGASLWSLVVDTDIIHPFPGEVNIFLTSPAGTQVSLSTGNGSNLNDFHGTTWRDDAGESNPPGPVTLTPFNSQPETPLAPEEPLGAFRGEDPNGVWTLNVEDSAAGGDLGTLESWGLDLTTLVDTPDSVASMFTDNTIEPIPDDGTPLVHPFTIPQEHASLAEYDLTTEILHGQSDDLVIELIPPSGLTITLASNQGGTNGFNFNGTVWADKAGATNPPGPVTDNVFVDDIQESPLAPQEPLSAAAGNQPGGQWALVVRDTEVNAITGTLRGLTFNGNSLICRPVLELNVRVSEPARLDEPVPALVVVQNEGADTTAPILVTATLPISAPFISAGGPSWTCEGVNAGDQGGTLNCERASSLAAGATTTVTVLLSPPAIPKPLGVLAATATTLGTAQPQSNDSDSVFAAANSANKQPWDVLDNLSDDSDADTGAVKDGGQDAFDNWGFLRLRVFNEGGDLLRETPELQNFGLVYAAGHRWRTTTSVITGTIQVARSLYAPVDADWLRYIDTFTNTSGSIRTVWVAWGGYLGSSSDTLTTASSSGDVNITAADTWAVTIENDDPVAYDPPLGYAWRSPADPTYQGPGIFENEAFTDTWPSGGDSSLGHNFKLVLAPGASASLAYFVYRGLAESEPGPHDCEYYGDCLPTPAAGSQVALAQTIAAALAVNPNFCDLSPAEFAKIVNWPGKAACGLFYLRLPLLQR